MYDNGNRHRLHIDLPSFNISKSNKNRNNKNNKNNKGKSNFKIFSIISKFFIVCIFFFVFIFCISRFGKIISKEYSENEFDSNLTYIKKEVLSYYNKNNIPQKNGDSSSFSLEELIEQKIINKDNIEDINNCDIKNSYVTLTKTRDKTYSLKIYINCNGIIEEKEDIIRNI